MTARCPACNAAVAAGAPWCTLCYADLRASVTSAEAPVRAGRHARPEPAPVAAGEPAAPAMSPDAMLALLAAETRPVLPGVLGRVNSPGVRIAIMLGGTFVLTLVGFALLAALGALLG